MSDINLSNRSAEELDRIAATAKTLAESLRKKQPPLVLALANGVCDKSYSTTRYGNVTSYSGEAIVTMADGSRWRCVGHGPTGGPDWIGRQGYVEFIPLDMPQSGIEAFDSAIPAGDTP